jgi:hypothetical protein
MITKLETVIDKMITLSEYGYLTASYENNLISLDIHILEKLTLDKRDNETYRLFYIDESHACPFEFRFKLSDVKDATYFAEGEFDKMPFGEIIVLNFNDGSVFNCFEDVR